MQYKKSLDGIRTAEWPMGNDFLCSRSYNNSSSCNHTDRVGAAEKATTGKKPVDTR